MSTRRLPDDVPGIDVFRAGELGSVKKGANLPTPMDVQAPESFCFREIDRRTRGPWTPLGAPPPDLPLVSACCPPFWKRLCSSSMPPDDDDDVIHPIF